MTETATKELQAKEKMEAAPPVEQTKPGRVFTPAVDILETDNEITLLADLSGVKREDLNIDLSDDILTLTGEVKPIEEPDEEDILIEYEVGNYYRQFTLSELIDQNKIDHHIHIPRICRTEPACWRGVPAQNRHHKITCLDNIPHLEGHITHLVRGANGRTWRHLYIYILSLYAVRVERSLDKAYLRFAAGVTLFGITSWESFMGQTEIPIEEALVHWDLWCYEHVEVCRRGSPIAYVDKARTPTLILQGEEDLRVPKPQSDELYAALRWKKVPVEYVVYPRERHGFRERWHRIDTTRRLLDWMNRYLKSPGS